MRGSRLSSSVPITEQVFYKIGLNQPVLSRTETSVSHLKKGTFVRKTALLSRTRPHKAAAVLLIVLAALSSFVFVYAFTALQGVPCPLYARPFQDFTMPSQTVFQLAPPGEATICLTVQTSGQLPLGSLSLSPELGTYMASRSMSSYSACSNS